MLGPDLIPGATVVLDRRAGPDTLSQKTGFPEAPKGGPAVPVGTPPSPPPAPKPQATVVINTTASQGIPPLVPEVPKKPQATVVFDASAMKNPEPGLSRSPGPVAPTIAAESPHRSASASKQGDRGVEAGKGVGKETMALLINDALVKERQRQGQAEAGAPAAQAQEALRTVNKMRVMLIGVISVLAIVLLALFIQNMQLKKRVTDQDSKIVQTDKNTVDIMAQMDKSQEEIEKARKESEEMATRKLQESEKRFQDILEKKDREYRAQMDELKQKAQALDAINTKIAQDRKETVAVSKQVTAGTDAAVVLVYCQYTLSNQENYDSHGTGFIVSPDGKVVTSKQVVEPWKFDPDIAAFIKVADLKLVKRDIYVWRLDSKVRQGADAINLQAAAGTAAGTLTLLKVAPDDLENQTYTREDTKEKIAIKVHRADSDSNLALLQIKGGSFPNLKVNASAGGSEVAPGAAVLVSGYPLGVEQGVAKPELLRASLAQFGNMIKIDKPITRGFKGAPLLLPDGSVIGVVVSESYCIPIRTVMKLFG
jgi:S1-C subfamily serine protease